MQSSDHIKPSEMPLPPLEPSFQIQCNRGSVAVVRCKGFRCAAYLDESGVWRSPTNGEQLEVLEVLMRF